MSGKNITISIMKSGKSKTLRKTFTTTTHTLRDIKQAWVDQEDNTVTADVFSLYKGKKEIVGDGSTLQVLKITRSQTLTITIKSYGGALSLSAHRNRNLDRSDPEIRISNKPDCLIFYDEKDGVERAEMPCGHAYCPQTMFDLVKRVFTKNNYDFEVFCGAGKCGKEFDFDLCSKVADMTDAEYEFFSKQIAKRSVPPTKECPHCHVDCSRPDSLDRFRIVCAKCKGADWCWECGKKWNRGGFTVCGNNGCASMTINDLLRECDLKKCADYKDKDGNPIMVPKIRACPKCLAFIQHRDRCKHMDCKDCGHKFCFACLKAYVNGQGWQCEPIDYQCTIAPRQQY